MTTPTPRSDAALCRYTGGKCVTFPAGIAYVVPYRFAQELERELAAAQDNRQYTCEAHRDEVKKGGRCVWCDLNVAHEELNTQAHELERLLNELSAAQERIEALEDALNMATQGKYSELMLRLADQVADQRTSRRIVK